MVKLGDSPIGVASTVPPPKAAEVDDLLASQVAAPKVAPAEKPRKKRKVAPTDSVPVTDMVGQVAEMVLAQGYTVRDLKTFCNLVPKALRMGWKNQNLRGRKR